MLQLVKDNSMSKGDVLTVGEIAGVCGAKKTSDLIPLCHPISLSSVRVKLDLNEVWPFTLPYESCNPLKSCFLF